MLGVQKKERFNLGACNLEYAVSIVIL